MGTLVGIWWVWLSLALLLGAVEVMLPGFIFLGFALGAAVMAVIVALFAPGFGISLALALFAGLSLAAWIGLPVAFRNQRSGARFIHHDIND